MPPAFSFASAPFDGLSAAEQSILVASVASVRFAKDEVLLAPDSPLAHAWLLVEGHVQLVEAGEVVAVDGPGDLCGARAALAGRGGGLLRALDEVLAWQIPVATLQALIAGNARFSTWLFGGIADRLASAADRRPQREFVSLMTARVGDAGVHEPFYLDGAIDLVSACRAMAQHDRRHVLVRDGERVGMFTTTDLRDALLRPVSPQRLALRDIARFELVGVPAEAEVFEALLAMIRHRVHRVVVRRGTAIVGVLSQLELVSFLANHSHLIALQIEQASGVEDLRQAALQIDAMVVRLHGDGIRIELVSRLVHELNRQLLARLWTMLAPPELVANSCLMVMGSEGRGEQILKTDQDNGLLLRDGYPLDGVEQAAERFNAALIGFGYPPCPGDIMVTNPLWRQPLAAFRAELARWMSGHPAEGAMHLAIFLDAVAVAGDASLLRDARRFVDRHLAGDDLFFARFALAADQVGDSGGWWERLSRLRAREEDEAFDLKKLGTFPVVHGVRTLALQHRVEEIGTADRLRVLAERGHLPGGLARDVTEALHFLMVLKLDNNLRQRRDGEPVGNRVRLSDLGTLERDLLKEALAIIKGFRQHLRLTYRLDLL